MKDNRKFTKAAYGLPEEKPACERIVLRDPPESRVTSITYTDQNGVRQTIPAVTCEARLLSDATASLPLSVFAGLDLAAKGVDQSVKFEIERDKSGKVVALWPIHPSRVQRIEGGFEVVNTDAERVFLSLSDVAFTSGELQ